MSTQSFTKAALVLAALGLSAQASSQAIQTTLNGQPLTFDQPALLQEGRVMVPLRGMFESLGAEVLFDPASRSIKASRKGRIVELSLGSRLAKIDGQPAYLDVPANTLQGRTLVPLRFVSEALGTEVRWLPSLSRVELTQSTEPNTPHPTPPGLAQLQSVTHNGSQGLQAGQHLIVNVKAQPGAQGTFDLVGLATDLPLREVSPGLYQGDFLIPAQVSVSQSELTAHLRLGNQEVSQSADRPLRILATQTHTLTPADGSSVTSLRPTIHANLSSPIQSGTARLFLDSQEVTSQVATTNLRNPPGTALHFVPGNDLSPGWHRVTLQAMTRQGQLLQREWSFQVQAPSGANSGGLQLTNLTSGASLPAKFRLQGQTSPYAQVTVQVQAQNSLIPGLFGVQSQLDNQVAQADAWGRFDIPLDLSRVPSRTPLVFQISVKQSNGGISDSTSLSAIRQ